MKVSTLNSVAKLASKISHAASLTALYRSIELNSNSIRCCSEFGNIEIVTDETGITSPVLLDTAALITVTGTLPQDAEITLTPLEGKIRWQCGAAGGNLNIVFSEHAIPSITHANFPWKPSTELANALILASSACQAAAVSVGLYGIVLEPEGDKLRLLSTNATALASVTIEKGDFPNLVSPANETGKVTLRPPVPGIIASFISTCPNCELDVTNDGIFIKGDWLLAHLPLAISLEHDIKEMADKYPSNTQTAVINSSAVKQFVNRARGLADKNAFFTVTVKVEAGNLLLAHAAIASSTEEIFLCSGLDTSLSYDSVPLPADMLLISLPYVKSVCFDYLKDKILVLRGTEPQFDYVIGGGSE